MIWVIKRKDFVKFLLATDLDNTLVGDPWATIGLNQRLSPTCCSQNL